MCRSPHLRELRAYWRATEARLNALPQFRTELDGLGIHFLRSFFRLVR